jgi:hypothetical protein
MTSLLLLEGLAEYPRNDGVVVHIENRAQIGFLTVPILQFGDICTPLYVRNSGLKVTVHNVFGNMCFRGSHVVWTLPSNHGFQSESAHDLAVSLFVVTLFKGASIDFVAEHLKSGQLIPKDLPVEVVRRGNQAITLNNRSFTALSKSGMTPTKIKDLTGSMKAEQKLNGRLAEMGGKPKQYNYDKRNK